MYRLIRSMLPIAGLFISCLNFDFFFFMLLCFFIFSLFFILVLFCRYPINESEYNMKDKYTKLLIKQNMGSFKDVSPLIYDKYMVYDLINEILFFFFFKNFCGDVAVGQHVKVYWMTEDSWYDAIVMRYLHLFLSSFLPLFFHLFLHFSFVFSS